MYCFFFYDKQNNLWENMYLSVFKFFKRLNIDVMYEQRDSQCLWDYLRNVTFFTSLAFITDHNMNI